MAKKRKKSKALKIAGFRIPRSVVQAAVSAVQTPFGKVLLAEALIQAATMLVAKQPTAAAAAAGSGAANAAKDLAGGARDAAATFMHGTADLLKASVGGTERHKRSGKKHSARGSGGRSTDLAAESSRQDCGTFGSHGAGNGGGRLWQALNSDLVRDALIGELSGRAKRKKAKAAKRH